MCIAHPLGLALLVGAVPRAGAQTVVRDSSAPLSMETLLRAPALAAGDRPSFSPDGRELVYTVVDNRRRQGSFTASEFYRTGIPWNGMAGDIWLSATETGESHRLVGGQGSNWGPAWSPDGRLLAFLSDRGSDRQARLWVWERASEKRRLVARRPILTTSRGLLWLSDGRSVLVATRPEGMSREAYVALFEGGPKISAGPANGPTVSLFSFDPANPDSVPRTDQFTLDTYRKALVVIGVGNGATRVLVPDARVTDYALSPDGRRLAYVVALEFERPGSDQIVNDLIVYDLATGQSRKVLDRVRLEPYPTARFTWSPDGTRLVYRTAGTLARDEVYIVPADGGAPRRIAEGPALAPISLDRPVWSGDGRYVFFTRADGLWRAASDGSGAGRFAASPGRSLTMMETETGQLWSPDSGRTAVLTTLATATKQAGFARIDLESGTVMQVVEEDRRYGGYATDPVVAPDGRSVAYVAEDARHPPDMWVLDAPAGRTRQISRVAPELAGHRLGAARPIEWRSVDGDTLHGALVVPAGYTPGTRYPLVVVVYGGSAVSNNLNRFGFAAAPVENLQPLATRGYAVLLADSKLNVGTPMVDLMKSVMPGIDKAVEAGVADPARIGVIGHSYGGYSTLALIAQSPRFKAAVMRAGTGDLIGSYGQLSPDGTNYGLPWAENGQGRMGGSPWEYRERYIENSPFFYLDRVRTPLLIIHGAEDHAVAPFLADQIFVALRRLGQTVTYARYGGEGHWEGVWSYADQIDYANRVIAWFDRYLKGEGRDVLRGPPGGHRQRGGRNSPADR